MRLKCIGCEVLARAIYLCAAQSPHLVDVVLLERGLHNTPAKLRTQLQDQIDASAAQGYDAVVLAYGLCGQATAGLISRGVPLAIPRAHDCITLFLGSRQRYQEQFQASPGTYWYTQDYIERRSDQGSTLALGLGSDTDLQTVYAEYVEKYGRENADYLMEVMGAWQRHYQRAVYIDLGVGDGTAVEAYAQGEADRRGWTFERMAGDLVLIRRLLYGDWGDDSGSTSGSDFLILKPGQSVKTAYDDRIIDCVDLS
ncbi:MAG TPA: DUF1638 domain-containing protein [Anaerolineales bacterium]|nr:DUF1638 domain-containing protein [Anaerolineales bacterium]